MRTLAIAISGLSIFFMLMSMREVQADVCSDTLSSLRPCMVSAIGSNPPPPSAACCKNIKSASPQTLCKCLAGVGSQVGSGINQDAAKKIPEKCGAESFKC
ncbi:hypothetical protein O6H91_02G142300 [Diphasiastrum complanatum]|uniref:Uncharacterized protein n=1 Tax=Diphasiastrum complanatum TaxID=34168 RepID=A0ACC2ELD2_DIPCM|nr:hypothetical protein O6H91_Y149300 [Diphasiastrum complanatum]KAJ7567315.1 hypothetical protein O6H91_02G142300 [Diphasiastrum complanatum]